MRYATAKKNHALSFLLFEISKSVLRITALQKGPATAPQRYWLNVSLIFSQIAIDHF
jgi:hypothetical protein